MIKAGQDYLHVGITTRTIWNVEPYCPSGAEFRRLIFSMRFALFWSYDWAGLGCSGVLRPAELEWLEMVSSQSSLASPLLDTPLSCFFLCLSMLCFSVNLLLQISQEYGLSPVWVRT